MKKKYTHIFFDLDNTLWDFKTNSLHAMESTFNLLGLKEKGVDFNHFFEVYSEHNHQLWTAYRKKEVKKKELTRLRFQLTFDDLNITGVDAAGMNDLYLQEMPKQTFLIDGAEELLQKLKAAGYKLYIITNGFVEVQHKKMESSGLQPYFEKVFISEELKVPKPGREIFEHAIKSGNAKKTSSLMIGDDWEVDIEGALNIGIDAVFYTPQPLSRSKDLPQNTISNTVSVIFRLSQLKPILGIKS